jgi:predicted nucleic acid-binding protein
MILVDSNVIIDVLSNDPDWAAWSGQALVDALDSDEVAINPIIYAELAAGFAVIEDLDGALGFSDFKRLPLPYEAGFVAGRVFVEYRRRGGTRVSPLPDFYVGAHAALSGFALLTRDRKRYQSYFPSVRLIAPP